MAPPGGGKAGVHGKADSIRAKAGNKRRANNAATSNPFGGGPSSSAISLASSLSSLFQSSTHGKDAALASLLASSSKPPVNLAAKQQKQGGLGLGALEAAPRQEPKADPKIKPTSAKGKEVGPVQKTLTSDKRTEASASPQPAQSLAAAAQNDGKPAHVAPTPSTSGSSQAAALSLLQGATSASPSPRGTPQPPQVHSPSGSGPPRPASQSNARPGQGTATSSAAPSRFSTPQAAPPLPPGRKPVFRPVLSSPLMVNWPDLPQAASQTVLHTLLDLLKHAEVQPQLAASFGGSHVKGAARGKSRGKGKEKAVASTTSVGQDDRETKRRRVQSDVAASTEGAACASSGAQAAKAQPWFIAGLNSTTRALERSVQNAALQDSSHVGKASSSNDPAAPVKDAGTETTITHLFVCRHDVSPPALVAHLPMLACSVNAVCHPIGGSSAPGTEERADGLHLVPLPQGSTTLLAEAAGLHSLTILALTSHIPTHLLAPLQRAIAAASAPSSSPSTRSETILRSDWMQAAVHAARSADGGFPLVPSSAAAEGQVAVEPTRIKLLRTTQPADLNACRVEKRRVRAQRSEKSRRKRESQHLEAAAARALQGKDDGGRGRKRKREEDAGAELARPRRTNKKPRRAVPAEAGSAPSRPLEGEAARRQRRRLKAKAKANKTVTRRDPAAAAAVARG